jgi:hypothetical protein
MKEKNPVLSVDNPVLSDYIYITKGNNSSLGKENARMSQITISWRAARVNRGFTLKEVAEICDKSVDTIVKYEKDSTDIPRDLMLKLLDIYGVHSDVIFFGKESDFIGKHRKNKQTA